MLILISNLISSNNVTVTSKSFKQLIVSSFQIKLPKRYGKHTSSSLFINLEVGEGMVTSLGVTSKRVVPQYQGNYVASKHRSFLVLQYNPSALVCCNNILGNLNVYHI